jgi:hypothetical protein
MKATLSSRFPELGEVTTSNSSGEPLSRSRLRIWKDVHGQDLIEYALMAGFVAVATGALMPSVIQHKHRLLENRLRDSDAAAS